MNSDGTDAKAEIETDKEDTPFFDARITSCLLSSRGDQVAFITEPWRSPRSAFPALWWTESDGTRVRKIEMNLQRHGWFHLVHWEEEANRIYLSVQEKTEKTVPIKKLIEADIEEGTYRILLDDIFYHNWMPVSPQGGKFIFRRYAPLKEKAHLVLYDTQTSSTKDIFEAKALGVMRIKWNRDGNQILFSRKTEGLELWRYNLSDDTVKRIECKSKAHFSGYDWLASDNRIVMRDDSSEETRLKILDDDLNDIKSIQLPDHLQRSGNIWGLDNAVLVQQSRRGGFWVLDLTTEKWKKVF
jgi:hypothetical protein